LCGFCRDARLGFRLGAALTIETATDFNSTRAIDALLPPPAAVDVDRRV